MAFSLRKKTGHFLLLLAAVDVIVIVIILLLGKLFPEVYCYDRVCSVNVRELIETAASRIAALLYLNSAAISLYVGVVSFKDRRNIHVPFLLPILLAALAAILAIL